MIPWDAISNIQSMGNSKGQNTQILQQIKYNGGRGGRKPKDLKEI